MLSFLDIEKIVKEIFSAISCPSCSLKSNQFSSQSEKISQYECEHENLRKLLSTDGSESDLDIIESVEEMLREAAAGRGEVVHLREEGLRMAESVGRQLTERDNTHLERVMSLEIVMAEKEKQLLQSSNLIRQQLAAAKREMQQLQRQLLHLESNSRVTAEGSLEQEIDSLRMVLDMKTEETEQLKAANNSLSVEMERFSGLEVKLQVQMQKTEEMNAVINMKNDQLRQVLDEYDSVQHQLEVEVSAHLACQQELEKSQWAKENFLLENEKMWKEVINQRRSGLILDVVQKEKGLAYRFNC
jgi:chromosome segregation ATPase